jgi:DNA-3-methyladenine glycosylase
VGRRLGRRFFARATVRVARALLGAELRVRGPGGARAGRIAETEAYLTGDPASHAFRGRTSRNRSMFAAPGTLYVFRIHRVVCANLVTRRGEAVLLRAASVAGLAATAASGPGRLCRVLGITIADDGSDVVSGSRFALYPRRGPSSPVAIGPRVGIRRAADRPLRFWIAGDPAVSRFRASSASASPSRSRADGGSRRSRTTRRPSSAGGRSAGRTAGR